MDVLLSSKQKQVIDAAFAEQQQLREQAQLEFNRIQKRIDEAVVLILDSHNVEAKPGISYKDGILTVPDQLEGGNASEGKEVAFSENHSEKS